MNASQKPVWTTSVTTPDTSPSLDAVMRPVTARWRESLEGFVFESGLDCLTIVVHLGNPPVAGFRERHSHNGALSTQFSTVALDHATWRDADTMERAGMLVSVLTRAIEGTPERRVTGAEKAKLVSALHASVMEFRPPNG